VKSKHLTLAIRAPAANSLLGHYLYLMGCGEARTIGRSLTRVDSSLRQTDPLQNVVKTGEQM
jgi:hypothetical protein